MADTVKKTSVRDAALVLQILIGLIGGYAVSINLTCTTYYVWSIPNKSLTIVPFVEISRLYLSIDKPGIQQISVTCIGFPNV